jgi:hypothetical protein
MYPQYNNNIIIKKEGGKNVTEKSGRTTLKAILPC